MLQFNNAEMQFNNAENKYALIEWDGEDTSSVVPCCRVYLRFEKYGSDHWTGKV